tara:strand:- start:84430 stop:85284 length:855 start_codon:yes stop_codon:yes gene_type:complete
LSNPGHITRWYRGAGYAAIWPACYALGVLVLCAHLLEDAFPSPMVIVYVLVCAHSCYLFDRVKLSDSRQDPADAIALPDRASLFAQRSRSIRSVVFIEAIAATVLGYLIFPLLALIPIAALGVVHLYAGRGATPGDPRLKDLPGLKAFIIASGLLSLSIAILWSADHQMLSDLHLGDALGLAGVWLVVSGDAALCDVDDIQADSIYRTQSMAVLLGARSAWRIALALISAGAALMAFGHPELVWLGVALVLSTILTMRNTNHRDFVDARLLALVLFFVYAAELL